MVFTTNSTQCAHAPFWWSITWELFGAAHVINITSKKTPFCDSRCMRRKKNASRNWCNNECHPKNNEASTTQKKCWQNGKNIATPVPGSIINSGMRRQRSWRVAEAPYSLSEAIFNRLQDTTRMLLAIFSTSLIRTRTFSIMWRRKECLESPNHLYRIAHFQSLQPICG